MKKFDLLGLGCVAVDDLLYVRRYAPPNLKSSIQARERHCGGLTATALVAASRLGKKCAYAGVLGTDDLSRFAIGRLQAEGIDLTHMRQREGVSTIYSTIIVGEEEGTRNIYFDHTPATGADPDWPPEEVILSCRALFVDHLGMAGMVRAARLARQNGIPVVADFERLDLDHDPLLEWVDHLIVSDDYACQLTRQQSPQDAASALWKIQGSTVVVTCGSEGCWYMDVSCEAPRRQPAFSVEVIDTTGCGDVFHGAYAVSLVEGRDLSERVRFAAAAAALKATRRGGQAGAPDRQSLETFLKNCSTL